MCILNEKQEQKQEKRPTTFYAWRLVDGKKKDFLTIKSYDSKEEIKQLLREANVHFDGMDVVH